MNKTSKTLMTANLLLMTSCFDKDYSSCFVSGTQIQTEHGPRPIESIQVGDKIWSWNTTLSKPVLRTVQALIKNESTQTHQIQICENTIQGVTD